jgi:hypothetical protein
VQKKHHKTNGPFAHAVEERLFRPHVKRPCEFPGEFSAQAKTGDSNNSGHSTDDRTESLRAAGKNDFHLHY